MQAGQAARQEGGGGGRKPPAGEAPPEAVPPPGQAAPDGADGPMELAGGLVVGQAFEVAEDQGGPVLLGQAGELLVERRAEFEGLGRGDPSSEVTPPRPSPPAASTARRRADWARDRRRPCGRRRGARGRGGRRRGSCRPCRARTRKVAWKASSTSWPSAEHPPAGPQDHRPVPGDQRLEGRRVAARRRTAPGAGPRPEAATAPPFQSRPTSGPPRHTARSPSSPPPPPRFTPRLRLGTIPICFSGRAVGSRSRPRREPPARHDRRSGHSRSHPALRTATAPSPTAPSPTAPACRGAGGPLGLSVLGHSNGVEGGCRPMRALVTGISGFVGGHLAEHLLESGDVVVGLSTSGRWPAGLAHLADGVPDRGVRPGPGRPTPTWPAGSGGSGPRSIYHLAAQANPQASVADPRGTWALNLGGTLTLLEAVQGVGPQAPGGAGRLGGLLREPAAGVDAGRRVVPAPAQQPVLGEQGGGRPPGRPALPGPRDRRGHGPAVQPRRPPPVVHATSWAALARQVAEVEAGLKARVEVGNLDIVRDFTDVRDVVRAYRLLADPGGTRRDLQPRLGRGTPPGRRPGDPPGAGPRPVAVRVDPARVRPVDQPLLVADATKLRPATGWEPRFSIEATLSDMLDDWRNAPRV